MTLITQLIVAEIKKLKPNFFLKWRMTLARAGKGWYVRLHGDGEDVQKNLKDADPPVLAKRIVKLG